MGTGRCLSFIRLLARIYNSIQNKYRFPYSSLPYLYTAACSEECHKDGRTRRKPWAPAAVYPVPIQDLLRLCSLFSLSYLFILVWYSPMLNPTGFNQEWDPQAVATIKVLLNLAGLKHYVGAHWVMCACPTMKYVDFYHYHHPWETTTVMLFSIKSITITVHYETPGERSISLPASMKSEILVEMLKLHCLGKKHCVHLAKQQQ